MTGMKISIGETGPPSTALRNIDTTTNDLFNTPAGFQGRKKSTGTFRTVYIAKDN